MLPGITREEVQRGQGFAKPGSIKAHFQFEAHVYFLSKDEGGLDAPFSKDYRPRWHIRTTDVIGSMELPKDAEMVTPGDHLQSIVTLIYPLAMDERLQFAVIDNGRTIGLGIISKVYS